jgi:hypothetical protein
LDIWYREARMFLCWECAVKLDSPYPLNFLKIEKEGFILSRAPSQNDFQGRHWRTYHEKFRKPWQDRIAYVLGRAPEETKHKRVIRLTAFQKDYRGFYDIPNLHGGCKPIVDSLKSLWWIFDDRPKYLIDLYSQFSIGGYDPYRHDSQEVESVGLRIQIYQKVDHRSLPTYPTLCQGCGAKTTHVSLEIDCPGGWD